MPPFCISSKILKQAPERAGGSALKSGSRRTFVRVLLASREDPACSTTRQDPPFSSQRFPTAGAYPESCRSARSGPPSLPRRPGSIAHAQQRLRRHPEVPLPVACRHGWSRKAACVSSTPRQRVSEVNSREVVGWKEFRKEPPSG